MVRLGEILLILVSVSEVRFNSSMVRLGGSPVGGFIAKFKFVSIPVWFDWEF